MTKSVVLVVGTRPNFVKAAPVLKALHAHNDFTPIFVHSGQHYDNNLSANIFHDIGIDAPDVIFTTPWNAEEFESAFSIFLDKHSPSAVLVFGDVDTTRIAAEVTHSKDIPLVHIEAGLRSFDSRMPEEANRIRTDELSDILFATEQSAVANIANEKLKGKVHFVGNTMIDCLASLEHKIKPPTDAENEKPTLIVTIHRRENIHNKETLTFLIEQLIECAAHYSMYWPLHPHTKKMIEEFNLSPMLSHFSTTEPEGYLQFLSRINNAYAVITDSGGIQEEATYLGVPCFTLRESTERPVTTEVGTNTLLSINNLKEKTLLKHMDIRKENTSIPDLWDGHAAERIVEALLTQL